MILKAKERGDGVQLGRYLMAMRDNDHVELHDLRGFVSDDIVEAFHEADAIAKGTRAKNHLFSLSLNPPPDRDVPVEDFEAAIGRVEGELGLNGQPRAIVFHEKDGRRHAHAVWSRIDGDEMKAINLPFYKQTLTGISRDLYREHGWEMPKGLRDRNERDPLSFSHAEWQQAQRTRQDPKIMKEAMRDAWAGSDTRQSFEAALRERGLMLAQGDRRGFVAVDWRGEVYSLSRLTGVKTKELQSRLGDPQKLHSTGDAKSFISERMSPRLQSWAKDAEAQAQKSAMAAKLQREQMVQRQRHLRDQMKRQHEARWLEEERKRAARTPTGMRGLWGWITGRNKKIRQENEAGIARAQDRDRAEKQAMIERQLAERRRLQTRMKAARAKEQERLQALNRDVAHYMMLGGKAPIEVTERFDERSRKDGRGPGREPTHTRRRDQGRDHEPG
ncbi:MAG: relaxase [Rhodobacteraceae bacterium]|nr:relaxase [Paracoccaceae bacterium]